jgi:hypothetical protein
MVLRQERVKLPVGQQQTWFLLTSPVTPQMVQRRQSVVLLWQTILQMSMSFIAADKCAMMPLAALS